MKIKLAQPDRSLPDPSEETLLSIAEQRGLLKIPREDGSGNDDEPPTGRLADAILWSITLTMLHFTLDVLVTHQYAVEISWPVIIKRAAQAFPGIALPKTIHHPSTNKHIAILLLVYSFHPHPSPSVLLPPLPSRIQYSLHQLLFLVCSIAAGCYLVHISNTNGYYAVMKQAPPVGCLWIWAVIELDLLWGTVSLISCVAFLKANQYAFL